MSSIIITTIITLCSLGVIAAIILYIIAQKFHVETDPKIDLVEEVLPATNCGGCGYPGCRSFAEALVGSDDISDMHCPVGGNDVMKKVGGILGAEVEEKDPYVAIVKCSGSFENRKKTNVYDGAPNCRVATQLYGGDTGCAYGCVGLGDCVESCDFDAMYMDEKTGLPIVIEDKCVACNACVKACPKDIMELWPKGRKNKRIYVACMNEEKGGVAKKHCSVACTGCEKCVAECKYDSIHVNNNLAVIDPEKCKLCRKCIDVCKSNIILGLNFPPPKERKTAEGRLNKKMARTTVEVKEIEATVLQTAPKATETPESNSEESEKSE